MPQILGTIASHGAGARAGDFQLISTTLLTGNQSSITFSNLGDYSTTYKHLQLRLTTRVDQENDQIYMRFNSDTGSNYARHEMSGNNSSTVAQNSTSQTSILFGRTAYSTQTANIFSPFVIDILDAFSSNKNTTIKSFSHLSAVAWISQFSGLWNNTASITTINIYAGATNFVSGSRFSLYGIKG